MAGVMLLIHGGLATSAADGFIVSGGLLLDPAAADDMAGALDAIPVDDPEFEIAVAGVVAAHAGRFVGNIMLQAFAKHAAGATASQLTAWQARRLSVYWRQTVITDAPPTTLETLTRAADAIIRLFARCVGELETKTPGAATEAICALLPTVRTTGQIYTAAIAQRPAKVQVLRWRARYRNVQKRLAKRFPRG